MSGELKSSPARKSAASGLSRITSSDEGWTISNSSIIEKTIRDIDDGESLEDLSCFTTENTFKINGKTLIIKRSKNNRVGHRRVFEQILVAQTKEQWRAGAGGTKQIHTVVDGDLTQKEIDDIKRAVQEVSKEIDHNFKEKILFPLVEIGIK